MVWCNCAHIRLIDNVVNDAMHIVTGCLRVPTKDYLPILAGILPAELRQQVATLSLTYHIAMDSKHLVHQLMAELPPVQGKSLRS